MNGSASFKTDYDLWEYLLVAHPDAEVNEKVIAEKEVFPSLHNHDIAIKTKPHITIANFLMKEPMEEIAIKWIQNICNLHTSFGVTLNNFSGFPPHTIYLRVQDPQPFKQLANALKILDGFIQSNGCPPLHLVTKPHLTIARALPEYAYDKAIKEYSKRSFHACFKVEKLFLLKRDAFMRCHLVNTFILRPPVTLFD
jgi:2'-5' RNA ligase